MRSFQGQGLVYLIVLAGFVDQLPKMAAIECFNTADGRIVQFVCRPSQLCCGSQCCDDDAPFYTHWYFWLAVCMFLMVIVGFAVSACRHFRKQRKLQQYCIRNKPKFGADLLLNYHLLRTDVFTLPLYEDVIARSATAAPLPSLSPPLHPHPPPLPPLPPPPAYGDACSCSSHNTSTSEDYNDHAPPAYCDCVLMQD